MHQELETQHLWRDYVNGGERETPNKILVGKELMQMDAVRYEVDFNAMSDPEIAKNWGKNIVKDNVVLVRNQNLDEAGILRVCELIGNVLKPTVFYAPRLSWFV